MIIKNKAENEAVLSNVGQVGEFRIRNSAKAFGILSSGLYANKIRAIIREYSCNAYDSHVEAGRGDLPFDVHLPNAMSPWFAVRDYGVGLDDQQVTNIFTTYFESTKTNTDELIGGLGLGSKSAFSYTDNFTITAIKAGTKRIYTAFINEQGVPSVAMMFEELTDEAAGVEIKFSVNDQYDFRKFREEAVTVFTTFKVRPNIQGVDNFVIPEVIYGIRDIIPGVHKINTNGGYYGSYSANAIMGNISYPLDVPNASATLGDLAELTNCALEIEFNIGELDIQASREGLSYIPETIAAIKSKLELIRDALVVRIAADADALTNPWERARFICKMANDRLTSSAAFKYAGMNPSPLLNVSSRYIRLNEISIDMSDLESWNIRLRGFRKQGYNSVVRTLKPGSHYNHTKGGEDTRWIFDTALEQIHFVVNEEGKPGSLERAKYHWGVTSGKSEFTVYVADPIDKSKDMDTGALLAALHTPPNGLTPLASLAARPKIVKGAGAVVKSQIMRLEKRVASGYSWRSSDNELVWRDAGELDEAFDDSTIYYYVPIKGHTPELQTQEIDCATLAATLNNTKLTQFAGKTVHGVRKADRIKIAQKPNWINLEEYIISQINSIDNAMISAIAASELLKKRVFCMDQAVVNELDNDSPYAKLVNVLDGMAKVDCNVSSVQRLVNIYKEQLTANVNFADDISAKEKEFNDIEALYPMLAYVKTYIPEKEIVKYIKMVDNSNKV